MELSKIQSNVFQNAKEHGFWPLLNDSAEFAPAVDAEVDHEAVNVAEKLMLMVEELGEALGHYRDGHSLHSPVIYKDEAPSKPDGFWVELADVVIRVLDLAEAYHINMEELIILKHEYNKNRPYKHGRIC